MASGKEIKGKIGSIKNTQKITLQYKRVFASGSLEYMRRKAQRGTIPAAIQHLDPPSTFRGRGGGHSVISTESVCTELGEKPSSLPDPPDYR